MGKINKDRNIDNFHLRVYKGMRRRNLKRGHGELPFSRDEFKEWLFKQDMYEELFKNWKESDHNIMILPVPDRLNDHEGYSFENMQLVTYKYNLRKSRPTWNGSCRHKRVLQKTLEGVFVREWDSIKAARDKYGGSVMHALGGRNKTNVAYGYRWYYSKK